MSDKYDIVKGQVTQGTIKLLNRIVNDIRLDSKWQITKYNVGKQPIEIFQEVLNRVIKDHEDKNIFQIYGFGGRMLVIWKDKESFEPQWIDT